ncbi:unnamed protein product [Parajaminaea phylloscopi]
MPYDSPETTGSKIKRRLRPLASLNSLRLRKSSQDLGASSRSEDSSSRSLAPTHGRHRRHSSFAVRRRAGPDQDDMDELRAVVGNNSSPEKGSVPLRTSSLGEQPSSSSAAAASSSSMEPTTWSQASSSPVSSTRELASRGRATGERGGGQDSYFAGKTIRLLQPSDFAGRRSASRQSAGNDSVETLKTSVANDAERSTPSLDMADHSDASSPTTTETDIDVDPALRFSARRGSAWDAGIMSRLSTAKGSVDPEAARTMLDMMSGDRARFSVRSLSDWDSGVFLAATKAAKAASPTGLSFADQATGQNHQAMQRSRSSTVFSDRRKSGWDAMFGLHSQGAGDLARSLDDADGVHGNPVSAESTALNDKRITVFSMREPQHWDASLGHSKDVIGIDAGGGLTASHPKTAALFSWREPQDWDARLFKESLSQDSNRASIFSRRPPQDWDACLTVLDASKAGSGADGVTSMRKQTSHA